MLANIGNYSSSAKEYFDFDSEQLLNFCDKFYGGLKNQSESLLEIKLKNLESIWNSLYESYRNVVVSQSAPVMPGVVHDVKEIFQNCSEAYYQCHAAMLDMLKSCKLRNSVSHTYQCNTRFSQMQSLSPCRRDYKLNSINTEHKSPNPIKNSESSTKPLKPIETQQDLSENIRNSTTRISENTAISNGHNLNKPNESQPTRGTTAASVISTVTLKIQVAEVEDLKPLYDCPPAVNQTAVTHSVGGRDLPERVENNESGSKPIAFKPLENKFSCCPFSIPLNCLTDKKAQGRIADLRVIHSRVFPHQTGQNPVLIQWRITKSIYHRFTLRWHNYLIHLPKHHRWKNLLIGVQGRRGVLQSGMTLYASSKSARKGIEQRQQLGPVLHQHLGPLLHQQLSLVHQQHRMPT